MGEDKKQAPVLHVHCATGEVLAAGNAQDLVRTCPVSLRVVGLSLLVVGTIVTIFLAHNPVWRGVRWTSNIEDSMYIHADDMVNGTTSDFCPKNREPRPSEVEDVLCMERPSFMEEYKNPCFVPVGSNNIACLPYFQLIGMDKSGSTDLFDRMIKHPDVQGNSGVLGKETQWWSWRRYGNWLNYKLGKKETFAEYLGYFRNSTGVITSTAKTDRGGYHYAVTGDGTPMDAWDFRGWPHIPQNRDLAEPIVLTPHLIKHINPSVKLIVIMRNPIDRLYSDYYFLGQDKTTPQGFHKAVVISIQYLQDCVNTSSTRQCLFSYRDHLRWNKQSRIHIGFYSEYLLEWLKVFPKEQFLFLRTEDYSADEIGYLMKVFNFLDVRALSDSEVKSYGIDVKRHKHKTKSKSSEGPMLPETRNLLINLYDHFNRKLAKMLQDDRFLWKDETRG